MIINSENIFLIVLALIWIIGAVLQDLRRREVDNLWNFSLIFFALAYRFSVFAFNGNYWFFINGILGFLLFLFLGNVFYYSRLFAGGDAKLLMALGTVLPLSLDWIINFKIFAIFILLFFITGSVYVLIWSFFLMTGNWKNFKKEFLKQARNYRRLFLFSLFFVVFWIIFSLIFFQIVFILIWLVFLLFPVLFVFAKSIEESCMIKSLSAYKITEGDWLYRDINVNGKIIKANWNGVSKKELKLIRKFYRRKILIKQGIPFTPGFLLGFIGLIYILLRYGAWL